MSSLSTMGLVLTDPHQAFERLRANSSPWLPLLSNLLLGAALMYWWVSIVDFNWLREHMMAAKPNMSGEERAGLKAFVTPTAMLWGTQIGIVAGTLGALLLTALYYLLAGKLLKAPYGYGKWFAFACWTSVPRLLVFPLMALQLATTDGKIAAEALNMASLAALLRMEADNPWMPLVASLDFTVVWSLVVSAIGLKVWTGRSTATCIWVAVIPLVIVYGLWALQIAAFS